MESWDADAFDVFEARAWAEHAAEYAARLVAVTAHAVEPLLDAARVGPGARVLDVAAGPGHVSAACAARGAVPTGLDVAHEMVAAARARHPDLDFRQGDAQCPPLPDGSVDAVVGNFAILHFGRPAQAVAEYARVLAPGGSVALSTWDGPDRNRMTGAFLEAAREVGAPPRPGLPDGPPFLLFADDAEFAGLLRAAGLVDVSVRTVAATHRFAGADDLWETMRRGTVRLRPLIFEQPPDVVARIRAVFDRLVGAYAGADGGLDAPLSFKIASGRKPLSH